MPAGSPSFGPAGPGALAEVVALLDEVFVEAKGRTGSLAERYPHVLAAPDESVRILVARSTRRLEAVTAVRLFDLLGPERLRGAMIGFVATRPAARGRGLASRLLELARDEAAEAGAQFAVLWTTSHAFYARRGWSARDIGMLGSLEVDPARAAASPQIAAEPLEDEAIGWIEELRARLDVARVARRPCDYRVLPEPSQRLELHRTEGAYALVGRAGDDAVLYELIGREEAFGPLLDSLQTGARSVLINDATASPSARWLDRMLPIVWREQRLAMWLPVATHAGAAELGRLHVPYLDRI